MLLRWVSVPKHDLDSGVPQHRGQCHKVNSGHRGSRGPCVPEIVKPEWRDPAFSDCAIMGVVDLWNGPGGVRLAREYITPCVCHATRHNAICRCRKCNLPPCCLRLSMRIEKAFIRKAHVFRPDAVDLFWARSSPASESQYRARRESPQPSNAPVLRS